jgi:SH3-like domain-containing protein
MISAATVLPVLSLLKWPMTITVAVLVFGLSTEGTLSLVSDNAHKLTKPIPARTDINVPPVKQIADLSPLVVVPKSPKNDGGTLVPSQTRTTTQVALQQPAALTDLGPEEPALSASVPIEPGNLSPGRIGGSAVNIRSGPSKSSVKLGVLAAGAEVRMGETEGGWVHVWHDGGEGWVYFTYLAGNATASITVRGGLEPTRPSKKKAVEVGSRMVARDLPDSDSKSVFRLQPGERVQILDRRGKWLRVLTVSGESGWIRAK